MVRILSAEVERWPVAGAFTISRGAKTHVDVIVVNVTDGRHIGRGEATPIYYHGETAQGCVEAVRTAVEGLNGPLDRDVLAHAMPRGAARNALDCALWDLEAKQKGAPVWALAGMTEPRPVPTAYTLSVDTPKAMESAAKVAIQRGFRLLKCKLTGPGDRDRIAAVREGAPEVRLIVDANESWTGLDLMEEAAALAALGVELIEQPVARGQEALVQAIEPAVPFCADESCQDRRDLVQLGGFAAINIKLDKAGGLTEAIALAQEAKQQSKRLMLGCMLSTSLGIAPAFLLAQRADWVDLDGAILLAQDRDGALPVRDGYLFPGTLWG